MISARRAAALGLTAPLSAIMVAVLGLWPEAEEDEPSLPPVYGGGRKRWRGSSPWPAVVLRRRVNEQPPVRSRPVDDDLADRVRRTWDEIDALRRQAPAADAPATAPAPAVAPFSVIVEGKSQTVSFSAPQPPDAWPDTRAIDDATSTRGDARARDDEALIALMVAELA